MIHSDLSYGVIPVRRSSEGWQFLLIRHLAGHWGFPKGHPDEGETPKEAAERELEEETAVELVRFLREEPFDESYSFTHEAHRIEKTVRYFLAEVSGEVKIQEEELQDFVWAAYPDAHDRMTFDEGRKLLKQAADCLARIS